MGERLLGEGRGEELFVGAICVALVPILARRLIDALRAGEVPLYRRRLKRSEAGDARFFALVAINVAALAVIAFIGADLLFGFAR